MRLANVGKGSRTMQYLGAKVFLEPCCWSGHLDLEILLKMLQIKNDRRPADTSWGPYNSYQICFRVGNSETKQWLGAEWRWQWHQAQVQYSSNNLNQENIFRTFHGRIEKCRFTWKCSNSAMKNTSILTHFSGCLTKITRMDFHKLWKKALSMFLYEQSTKKVDIFMAQWSTKFQPSHCAWHGHDAASLSPSTSFSSRPFLGASGGQANQLLSWRALVLGFPL